MSAHSTLPGGVPKAPTWIWIVVLLLLSSIWLKACYHPAPPAPKQPAADNSHYMGSQSAGASTAEAPLVDVSGTVLCKGSDTTIATLAPGTSMTVRVPSKTDINLFRTDTHTSLNDGSILKICNAANPSDCGTPDHQVLGARFLATNQSAEAVPVSCEYDPRS